MYRHLLIATDGSPLANKAVEQGLSIAKVFNAKVTIVTVTEPWMMSAPGEVAVVFPLEEYEKAAASNASKILKDASTAGTKYGIACETVHVNCRCRQGERLRSDRDVIAWTPGADAARARQSGQPCGDAQYDIGTHLPIKLPELEFVSKEQAS